MISGAGQTNCFKELSVFMGGGHFSQQLKASNSLNMFDKTMWIKSLGHIQLRLKEFEKTENHGIRIVLD